MIWFKKLIHWNSLEPDRMKLNKCLLTHNDVNICTRKYLRKNPKNLFQIPLQNPPREITPPFHFLTGYSPDTMEPTVLYNGMDTIYTTKTNQRHLNYKLRWKNTRKISCQIWPLSLPLGQFWKKSDFVILNHLPRYNVVLNLGKSTSFPCSVRKIMYVDETLWNYGFANFTL